MKTPLRIFIGFDSREPVAYHVLSHSILTRASIPVAIIPLHQNSLRRMGIYTRELNPLESTEFSFTRFLVPHISNYEGISVFMDSDMLMLEDVAELIVETYREPEKWAVRVCQHDYTPKSASKFLGNVQTAYPRKNWSSFMVFNNAECGVLTPEYVNTATGLELHRFQWTKDDMIGELPLVWNWLVGEYGHSQKPIKNLHFTLGGPWFFDYKDSDYSEDWQREFEAMSRAAVSEAATCP